MLVITERPLKRNAPCFSLSLICVGICLAITSPAFASGLYFDPAMLTGGAVADLSGFENNGQSPGIYSVDVYLNGHFINTRNVRFVASGKGDAGSPGDDSGLSPLLTKKMLADMGVNVQAIRGLYALDDNQSVMPGKFIPQADTAFDFSNMRLNISIPQAALLNRPHGWISPEQWDEGINAALMSWQLSGNENRGAYGNSRTHYLSLRSGLNLGPWRLRDDSTYSDYENNYNHERRWQHLNTYIQRAIIPLRSELTLGDSTTGGDVFDALPFRGVRMATDDSMYPDSMRGYAPVVRGVASSNAQVTIRQNGNVIYQTYVAPGAFVINDLMPVSSGGDFVVSVREADGTVSTFTVPYSSVPVLQRQGHLRYDITAGRYRSNRQRYNAPAFTQGTLLWGLPHNLTAYSGVQLSDRYRAVALGAGLNMGEWGAVSGDITHAHSVLTDGTVHDGQSLRFLYSRSLLSTGTTFQLAGYRYSTQGFHTLDETALQRMSGWYDDPQQVDAAGRPVRRSWTDYYNLYSNKRERTQLNLSQRLGKLGSVFVTGNRQTYYGSRGETDSVQAGYSGLAGRVSYSLSYGYTRYHGQPGADRTLYFSLSLPLDGWLTGGDVTRQGHNLQASYSAGRDADGNISHQVELSGSALDHDRLDWSVSQGYGKREGDIGDASLDYTGTYGSLSAGYGYSHNYQQVRYGASGGAILHSGGLTLGQPLSNTSVLVAAPGAAGVPLDNESGVRTDWRGYTIVPYATVYRENRIALDVSQLDDHTEIDNSIAHVIPTQGAIVRADFHVHTGSRAMITITHDGKPLPFGTSVSTAQGAGIAGDDGEVFLSGLAPQGTLTAQWGAAPDQRCVAHYSLTQEQQKATFVSLQENCR